MMWGLLLVTLGCIQYACAYSKGAPSSVCDSMIPGHRASVQTGASPFKISAPVKKCEKDVTVTVSANGGSFRGFLCQPRRDKDVPQTSGTFTPLGNTTRMQNKCDTLTSLCHTSKETKTEIQFKWTPVANETAYIVCSFVQTYDTFWVKESSPAVTLDLTDSSCQTAGVGPLTPGLPGTGLCLLALVVIWLSRAD